MTTRATAQEVVGSKLAGRAWSMREFVLLSVVILIVWGLLSRFVVEFPAIVLPSPAMVLTSLVENFGTYAGEMSITVYAMVLGFLAGGAMGFVSAVGIFYSPYLRRSLYPLLLGFRIVPKVAFVPLFLIWFGIGIGSKVALAAFSIFFLLLIQTLLGLHAVEPELVELGRSLRMREWLIFRKIRLPVALPAMMVGVKLGIAYALTNVVVAEMVVASRGLGWLIIDAKARLRTADMLAAIVVVAVIGLIFYAIGIYVERRTTFWHAGADA